MDASNLLKPALARGELHCVGATTLDEYRKHVEKDAALARRFQPVFVGRADGRGHHLDPARPQGEVRAAPRRAHHRSGARGAATLSNRYITDRFLPDKAIDLMDEAASRMRMEVDSKPEELDELDRRIIQLKIEREALKKEKDAASKDRLATLEKELAELEASRDLTAAGRPRRTSSRGRRSSRKQLDAARNELEAAQRKGDLAKRGRAAYGRIPELEKQLAEAEEASGRAQAAGRGSDRRGTSPRWSRAGPAFRSTRCWKASARSCCDGDALASAWSARKRR
jgi:ATP-dependent Clp protease ATP-binding subunit ClpB